MAETRCFYCAEVQPPDGFGMHNEGCLSLPAKQPDRELALLEAGNEMARVLDEEIMPRYIELLEEAGLAGLGAVRLSIAVEDATRVLARWRRATGLG